MVANVESMMYNAKNGKPWHDLGTPVSGYQNWKDAMIAAGLQWTVDKQSLYDRNGNATGVFGIFRSDNNVCLGAVGDVYATIQNQFAFEFVDTLIENHGAHYDTAGSLGRGERIWCLAKIGADFAIPGTQDKHESYLLFETSHDGSRAATAKLTTVRVVCQNTLNAALRGSGESLSVRHTRSADEKLKIAKSLMNGAVTSVASLKDKLITLSQRKLTRETLNDIMERIFPTPAGEKQSTRRDNQMGDVLRLYESNDRNAIPEIKGTAYNLLNAVTEYTDHKRSARITDGREHLTTAQARTESALFGSGSLFKEKALEMVLVGSKDCQTVEPKKYFVSPSIETESKPPYKTQDEYIAGFDKGKLHRRIGMTRDAAGMTGQMRQGYLDGWNSGS